MILYIVAGGLALRCISTSLHVSCSEFPIGSLITMISLGTVELVAEVYKIVKIFKKKDDD